MLLLTGRFLPVYAEMKKIQINENFCVNCGLCKVYCTVEHSQTKDIIKAFKRESPAPVPRVRTESNGDISFAVLCQHCAEPWCVYSCLTGAMHKDPESNAVVVDEEKCVGCWTCIISCPYGILTRDGDHKHVVKCDLCPDREIPACVDNCPNEALTLVEDVEEICQAVT